MGKAVLTLLFIVVSAQFCLAQEKGPSFRVGDAFRGQIKTVRMEMVRLSTGSNGELIESAPVLQQLITYSEDGLTRTAVYYSPRGSVNQNYVETYRPDGNRVGLTVTRGEGSFVSRWIFEYDERGHQISEIHLNADGSVKDRILTQALQSEGHTEITRVKSDGAPVEVAINSRDVARKKSTWTTTKPDGSCIVNNSEVDQSGTHHDESVKYKADGSVDERRVSIVDAGVTRLESTIYNADGSVRARSLNTREYDSSHNLIKGTNYRWNTDAQKFEPDTITYSKIIYRD